MRTKTLDAAGGDERGVVRTTNTVKLRKPVGKAAGLQFPAQPMLGCAGVAGPVVSAPNTRGSGSWGGNMDYNEIGEGATLILPVYHKGGLFFLGNGHALPGRQLGRRQLPEF